jgi:glycosyltransferase involved in cell wall biosynthesis
VVPPDDPITAGLVNLAHAEIRHGSRGSALVSVLAKTDQLRRPTNQRLSTNGWATSRGDFVFSDSVFLSHTSDASLDRGSVITNQESGHKPRVLVFVVAYEAESTLRQVLGRIPSALFERCDTEVLVIDDSSKDATFEVGLQSAWSSPHPITVLHNPINQGYGGNQKLGYQYAIRNGFDFVVLLHGDGQYAPECIPDMIAPLVAGEADAVFGSRMMTRLGALKGGMPLYKFVGNRILSWTQNRLLRTRLSEFHSGFRAYRVATLALLPFQYNSNAFHFDTEIIIQLVAAGARISEIPIPTYYGDEICRVNGLLYAKDVVATTVASRFHRMNFFYDRKFDVNPVGNQHYALKLGYPSSHTAALEAVPDGARVLDLGCGPGTFATELRKKARWIAGADQFPPADPRTFDRFFLWKEGDGIDANLHEYDIVLLLDVIEHMKEPEAFLDQLRHAARSLDRRPAFVVTTGNVVFLPVRLQSLLGNFNYGKRGILDLTHTRLYTFKTITHLFEQCGFAVEEIRGIPAPFPEALGNGALARFLVRVNAALIRLSKGMFAYQIFLRAVPTATVDAMLDESISASASRAETTKERLLAG